MRSIGELGENAFIEGLAQRLPVNATVATGIGDDCAVVRVKRGCANDLLLTSDPVIEGVHFRADAPAEAVGHKALGRVLSDIAAMGGKPLWVLLNLVAPARTPLARLTGIYRGAGRLARRAGMPIVGGDTAQGKVLELHAFAVGRVPHGTAILRSGARRGDRIYVTGTLGGSGAGKHLRFTPRLAEGQWLREYRWATAMMDISDGLATDLRRMLAASGTGARLEAGRIPVSREARRMQNPPSPLGHALCDGEDFELLVTVAPRKTAAFEQAWKRRFRLPCTQIGVMTGNAGLIEWIQAGGAKTVLRLRGYEHFGSARSSLGGKARTGLSSRLAGACHSEGA